MTSQRARLQSGLIALLCAGEMQCFLPASWGHIAIMEEFSIVFCHRHRTGALAFSTGPRVALSSLMSASKSFSSVGSAMISSGSNKFSKMTVTYTRERVLKEDYFFRMVDIHDNYIFWQGAFFSWALASCIIEPGHLYTAKPEAWE